MIDAARLANLKRDVKDALLNNKVIAFPIACRVAWHASGTFDARDGSGGSDGGTMRFEPEKSDPANAGLGIVRDMLHEVHKKYPDVSQADIFTLAGALSIEFAGGPHVPHAFGRTDDSDGSRCPAHGRLPDASQGATHLRDVFHRMGMSDRDIVALSGAHTLGRCHFVRSGYDGKWTRSPLRFDNEYFRNLIHYTWKPREWDGQLQYTDVETGELMMLPTDVALKTDANFRPYAELYARDQEAFFRDFSAAYSRLLALGTTACPHLAGVNARAAVKERDTRSWEFREACMHGVVDIMPLARDVDLNAGDAGHRPSRHPQGCVLGPRAHDQDADAGPARGPERAGRRWGHRAARRREVRARRGVQVAARDARDRDGDKKRKRSHRTGAGGGLRQARGRRYAPGQGQQAVNARTYHCT